MSEPDEASVETARQRLQRLGIPTDRLSDQQAVTLWGAFLKERISAPPISAGTPPVNARAWAAAALTAGGFVAPEDRQQRADLGDEEGDIDLGIVGILVMRHLSGSRPDGWTDDALAARLGADPAELRRAQHVVDQAADDTGRAATPAPRWWLGT